MGDCLDGCEVSATTDINKPVIYLTGFGPFGPYERNASEAAVSILSKSTLSEDLAVELITDVLEVDYNKTEKLVPRQWQKHKPKLVVHVGVSGIAQHLTLELQADNTDYECRDNKGCCPQGNCCVKDGPDTLYSGLPLARTCDALNAMPHLTLRSKLSTDPGKFLCSYVYYTSLQQDASRSVFIHVPPIDVSSALDTAAALREAVVLLYQAVGGTTAPEQPPGGTASSSNKVEGGGVRTNAAAECSSDCGLLLDCQLNRENGERIDHENHSSADTSHAEITTDLVDAVTNGIADLKTDGT